MNVTKKATIDVRNAVFQAADGKPADAVLQGIVMALGKIGAGVCGGDEAQARAMLDDYHRLMMNALPLYCVEVQTGQSRPS